MLFTRRAILLGVSSRTIRSFSTSASTPISISNAVGQAADLLPTQPILENFIHQNPLRNLESMNFNEAIEHAHKLESYMSPGERVKHLVRVDPRKRVHEALAELCSAFLDRGASKWAPSFRSEGFLYFFASLEGLGFAPWRKHARYAARRITAHLEQEGEPSTIAETILEENLQFFGIPRESWVDTIRSMLLEAHGWSGMFHRMETRPVEAPDNTNVRLIEFCAVQSILSRSSMIALARKTGWEAHEIPFASWLNKAPKVKPHEIVPQHTSAIAFVDQHSERREMLEVEFEHMMLDAIGKNQIHDVARQARPALQLYTCIDDRECSLRRHVEQANPKEIETFGVAGFFGIPVRYKPADGRDEMILAPDGQNPSAVLVERECKHLHEVESVNKRRRFLAHFGMMWEKASFSPIGSLFLSAFFPLSIARLLLMGFAPQTKQTIKDRFQQTFLPKPRTDFDLPFSHKQSAELLARTFKDIGTHKSFAPIVVVLGHGATSVNNPYAAAYNCGACGGREGGPNARLLARLANNRAVRMQLKEEHSIDIPDDTMFIGGLHNTTNDTVEFYDVDLLPETHHEHFSNAQRLINQACGKNALERCHRFLLANVHTPEEALRHVQIRSIDAAEVRPELNHATNAGVIIGRRSLSKGTFLDRRVFLPAYDPLSDDDAGTNLEHVLAPALVVCSGINLEYLFSTIDAEHHGAGTKAPLNVVGNIGVLQGTSGDLRPGLPTQMTEMHIPVRALYIVDTPVRRIEAVLSRREDLRRLVHNEWVRLIVRDSETGGFYKQVQGTYLPISIETAGKVSQYDSFKNHRTHGISLAHREDIMYWGATTGMLAACAVPIYLYGAAAMNPHGTLIVVCASILALPVLAFSRRYLHGEFMFGRFATLCVGLLLGFNLVATAPTLVHAVAGWSLFGFASTFLIGAYNDRPTVRNNATFAFAAYKISDFAMLVAAAFSAHHVAAGGTAHPELVATGLLVAAMFKSSQFPLAALFLRSMEGPTPASALGYAGLSAHVGIILLSSTMPLWFGFEWVRIALGSIGLFTAVHASLISRIRADRKGAVARATSATIGLIFVTLAMGYSELALVMSLGHAAFRMIQILRAPNVIAHTQALRSALQYTPWPKTIPDWLYRFTWTLRRIDTDFHLLHLLHRISSRLIGHNSWKLTKIQQWLVTGVSVVLAGAPFTPLSHYTEEMLMEMLQTQPYLAGAFMAGYFAFSVVLIRFLFVKVLSIQRFRRQLPKTDGLPPPK